MYVTCLGNYLNLKISSKDHIKSNNNQNKEIEEVLLQFVLSITLVVTL